MHSYLSFGGNDEIEVTWHDGDESTEAWVAIETARFDGGGTVTMTHSQFEAVAQASIDHLRKPYFGHDDARHNVKIGDRVEVLGPIPHVHGAPNRLFGTITGMTSPNGDWLDVDCGIFVRHVKRSEVVVCPKHVSTSPRAILNGVDLLAQARQNADRTL